MVTNKELDDGWNAIENKISKLSRDTDKLLNEIKRRD